MADSLRYRYGETNPVQIPHKSGVALGIGDLCFEDPDDSSLLKPASSYAWGGSLGATQQSFAAQFAGVNLQRWDGTNLPTGNKDGDQRVATSGIFEFDVAAGTPLKVGDFVAPAQNIGGTTALENQTVVKTTTKAAAIGRVEKNVANASKVLVRIFSAKLGPLTN